jgi:peptidoglycan/LPS O-acetylase OafA/YrhL
MDEITARLTKIEERNVRVEADKAWEMSWARKISVAVLTYLVVCLFLYTIDETDVWLKALIPVLGFILSTVSLQIIRKIVR